LGIWKDSHFTRLFSTVTPGPISIPTYACFAIRDCLTIFASFNVPPLIAPHIPREFIPGFMKGVKSQSIAQFVAPATIQLLSTPAHLLGLDMYNRPGVTLAERWSLVKSAYNSSVLARIGRIVPAFGFGGIINSRVRKALMEPLE
jgi:hypothetical protein